ncbi:MAG: hypothetical protein JW699_07545 [Chitinispirillaceae bacterium]|nr:hypothetical protein [Chitinispirillaceae bacterium]
MSVVYPSSCDASGKSIKVENTTSGENSYFTGHKVGIGTTSPQAELHTKGGSNSGDGTEHTGLIQQGTSYGQNAGSQLQFDIGDGSDGPGYGAAIAATVSEGNGDYTRLEFRTKRCITHSDTLCNSSDTKMSLDANGNVGIGATNKLSKLTIVGRASRITVIGYVSKTSGYSTLIGTNFLTQVGIGDRISVPGGAVEVKTVTAIADDTNLTVDSNWEYTASDQPAELNPSNFRVEDNTNALQMIIHNDGNVGIGTITPEAKLDIAGTVRIKTTTNSTTAVQVQASGGATVLNVDTTNSRVGIGSASPSCTLDIAGTARIKTTTNSPTAVQVQTSDGATVLDVDTTNSRVGIGTTSPASVVEIKGPRGTGNTGQLLVTSDVDEPAYIQVRATDINDPCGIQFIGNESTSNPEWTIQVPSGGGGTSDNLQFIVSVRRTHVFDSVAL